MNPTLVKTIFRPFVKPAVYAGLIGRNRDRHKPEMGRFTRLDADNFLRMGWETFDQLAPSVPQEPKIGNRMNMLLACMTLAFFRIFMMGEIEREYAIEIFGDVTWNVYEKMGRFPHLIARLFISDPVERLQGSVNMFLRFPFTPPGYVFERQPRSDGISVDILRCPVAEYFHDQDAPDLCIGTWCNLDFALAEMWGGWLERTETLAAGSASCNFRFRTYSGAL